MSCRHLVAAAAGCDTAFTVDASRVTFGPGRLAEVGDRASALGMRRVALFTDARLRTLPWFDDVMRSLAGPRRRGVRRGRDRADRRIVRRGGRGSRATRRPDGYVSLGGGSVIDTGKAANLYATHPAPLRTYVNAPARRRAAGARARSRRTSRVRRRRGPAARSPASRSSTGSRSTRRPASRRRGCGRPRRSSIRASPQTLPATVVAASGMDVLCHALESYTARPFTLRARRRRRRGR